MNKHLLYTNKLQDKLNKDLSWRKKEISNLSLLINSQEGDMQISIVRGAITLLYSHWEGFIKNASILYLEYVCKLQLPLSQLTDNFCHISLGEKFPASTSVHSYQHQKALFEYIVYDHKNSQLSINPKHTIDTKSNLKFEYFKTISSQLGIDTTNYETKENFINEVLLGLRNAIAHGEYRRGTTLLEDFITIKGTIIELLDQFNVIILDAFEKKIFLR